MGGTEANSSCYQNSGHSHVSQKIIQSEVNELYKKFRYLRVETHKQFSSIMNAHEGSIDKGINDLAEVVGQLQAHVSVITNEVNILLETVANLNGEIRQLNAKLPVITGVQEAEKIHDGATQDVSNSEQETPAGNEKVHDQADQDEEESVCQQCNFTFSTNENLTIHWKNFHSHWNESG